MTRAELLEENRALKEALRSIFEQVAELLDIEVEDLETFEALE